jgi:hypothetical protein
MRKAPFETRREIALEPQTHGLPSSRSPPVAHPSRRLLSRGMQSSAAALRGRRSRPPCLAFGCKSAAQRPRAPPRAGRASQPAGHLPAPLRRLVVQASRSPCPFVVESSHRLGRRGRRAAAPAIELHREHRHHNRSSRGRLDPG